MRKWILFALLTLSLIIMLLIGYVIPLIAYFLIAYVVFIMTPVMIKNFIQEEEFPPMAGTLVANIFAITLSFFILFVAGESSAPLFNALKWALGYFFFTGLAYFAVRQIMNN